MTRTVWVTGKGSRFHEREDCTGLTSGQDGSAVQDYELHPVEVVSVVDAQSSGKTPCQVCSRASAPS